MQIAIFWFKIEKAIFKLVQNLISNYSLMVSQIKRQIVFRKLM